MNRGPGVFQLTGKAQCALGNELHHCLIAQRIQLLFGTLCGQPSIPPVAGWIDPQPAQKAPYTAMTASLHTACVAVHAAGTPGVVACDLSYMVPIRVMRQHEYHR